MGDQDSIGAGPRPGGAPQPQPDIKPGLAKVRAAAVDALRDVQKQKQRRADPPPFLARGDSHGGMEPKGPGKWSPDKFGLPREDPCPVQPLGKSDGIYYVIDSSGQFRELDSAAFSHSGIQDLFDLTPNYPKWAWPRYGKAAKVEEGEEAKTPPIKSFEDDAVREALFMACGRRGLFNPSQKMRGRGCWLLGGAIVYHAGEDLWRADAGRIRPFATGLHQGHLYPRLAELPPPWPDAVSDALNPARALLEGFRKWNFERPEVDPVLLLGWIGVAYLGAALDWRSAVFLCGDKNTGKSSLQKLLKTLFGEALLDSANLTPASIYQELRHDCIAVAIDELEASASDAKVMAVIELARGASSGTFVRRGGQSGKATALQMHSAFLFSAINMPPLLPADRSRVAMLNLLPLGEGASGAPIVVDADTTGRQVLARLLTGFARFPAIFQGYREVLAMGGHNGRGQDTFGTLLACAELLLGDTLASALGVPMGAARGAWAGLLAADAIQETQDLKDNWHDCLDQLLTTHIDAWRGGSKSCIGEVLHETERVAGQPLDDALKLLGKAGMSLLYGTQVAGEIKAQGLELEFEANLATLRQGQTLVLVVPADSRKVHDILKGGRFAGTPDAGVWGGALRQAPGHIVIKDRRLNRRVVDGVQKRCVLINMTAFRLWTEK